MESAPQHPNIRTKPLIDRKDTPWVRMDDSSFAARIDADGGRVLIGLKAPFTSEGIDNTGRVLVSQTLARSGIEQLRSLGVDVRYEFRKAPVIAAIADGELAASLRRNPWVDYVEPHVMGTVYSQTTPWGITKVQAPSTWALSTGSGVKVLVLDTGIDSASVNVSGADLTSPVMSRCLGTGNGGFSNDIYDYQQHDMAGHGTHIAGTIAALNNSSGVVGGGYGITLWSANVTWIQVVNGQPENRVDFAEAACSIDVARVNGVRVVNMSFGGSSPSTALTDQINGGWNNDNMVFVAAVGNDASTTPRYPATLSNVIAVTAVDSLLNHPTWANTSSTSLIDLAAPGVAILSTGVGGGGNTDQRDGTSMAAAHVSAAAALLIGRYPTWTNSQIRDRLLGTTYTLTPFNTFGYGLVYSYVAVAFTVNILGPSPIYEGDQVTISAAMYGGQSPYSYAWTLNGSPAGSGSSISFQAWDDFTVYVTVTDYYGLPVTVSRGFEVTTCQYPCA